VTVIVAPTQDGFVVHDNSLGAMALQATGTSRASILADEVTTGIAHYGCELNEFRVSRKCSSADEIALSAILVGCASRLVADQALKVGKMPMADFKSRLVGVVADIVGIKRIRTNEQIRGHLGSRYKVSTVVLDSKQARPMAFVEPVVDQKAIARRFKEFYDISLNESYSNVQRVSVLDDVHEIPKGDALLMQEVSTLLRFKDAPALFRQWTTLQ